jgi:hypothetical protein
MIPTSDAQGADVMEGGKVVTAGGVTGVKALGVEAVNGVHYLSMSVGSGTYAFTSHWIQTPPPTPSPPPTPTSVKCAKVLENLKSPATVWLGGCAPGKTIDKITFASWGTPTGDCTTGFKVDPKCNSADTTSIVSKLCLGKSECAVLASKWLDNGKDPCLDTSKWLAASVHCQD